MLRSTMNRCCGLPRQAAGGGVATAARLACGFWWLFVQGKVAEGCADSPFPERLYFILIVMKL